MPVRLRSPGPACFRICVRSLPPLEPLSPAFLFSASRSQRVRRYPGIGPPGSVLSRPTSHAKAADLAALIHYAARLRDAGHLDFRPCFSLPAIARIFGLGALLFVPRLPATGRVCTPLISFSGPPLVSFAFPRLCTALPYAWSVEIGPEVIFIAKGEEWVSVVSFLDTDLELMRGRVMPTTLQHVGKGQSSQL